MAYYVIDHRVGDYKNWEKIYRAFEPTRKKYGVKEHYVLRSSEDADHVLVLGEGELDVIKTFLGEAAAPPDNKSVAGSGRIRGLRPNRLWTNGPGSGGATVAIG